MKTLADVFNLCTPTNAIYFGTCDCGMVSKVMSDCSCDPSSIQFKYESYGNKLEVYFPIQSTCEFCNFIDSYRRKT